MLYLMPHSHCRYLCSLTYKLAVVIIALSMPLSKLCVSSQELQFLDNFIYFKVAALYLFESLQVNLNEWLKAYSLSVLGVLSWKFVSPSLVSVYCNL